jgi:hypothetical protein
MAAQKPANKPEPRLMVVSAPLDSFDLSNALKICSAIFSKATNLVIVYGILHGN